MQPERNKTIWQRLRRITDTEYTIDGLTHEFLAASGWMNHMYTLTIDPQEEEAFTIMEESREMGDDCVLSTADADEVEAWILERIKERESDETRIC